MSIVSTRTTEFVRLLKGLTSKQRKEAWKSFVLWREDPAHPSLEFKCVDRERRIWSARASLDLRVLGIYSGSVITWFWIGKHSTYDKMLSKAGISARKEAVRRLKK